MMQKNKPRVRYSKRFQKELQQAPVKIQRAFRKRRELFLLNPHHSQLRHHALTGALSGYRSMNVTGDWRALFSVERAEAEEIVIFRALGTHSQLYR